MEKMKPQFGYNLQHTNIDPDICLSNMPSQILVNIAFMLSKKIVTEFNLWITISVPRELWSSMQIKRQLYQEKMAQLELERMQLNELGFNPMTQISSPNYKSDSCKYLSGLNDNLRLVLSIIC